MHLIMFVAEDIENDLMLGLKASFSDINSGAEGLMYVYDAGWDC